MDRSDVGDLLTVFLLLSDMATWWTLVTAIYFLQTLYSRVLCQCSGSPLTVIASESPTSLETPGYSSGGYANNINCEWLIDSGVTGQRILLYSDEYDFDCSLNDYINIYDGSTSSDTNLETNLCGSSGTTGEYISSGRYVLVTFTSDASSTGQGFQLTFVTAADTSGSGCTAEYTLTASETPQYLTSDGFPGQYSSSSSCRWRIAASNSISTVNIEIVFSDIENDVACAYDKLTIYDGSYICENKVLLTQCPSRTTAGTIPNNYTSTGDSFLVILTSDSSFERHGFIIKYTENFVNFTTTSTTSTTSTTPSMSASSAASVIVSSIKTETITETNIPLMAASAVAGAAFVLGLLAGYRLITYIKARKRLKKGIMTVQAIAPLPARPTVFAPRQRTNVLSFV